MEYTLHSMGVDASFLTAENWDLKGKIPGIPKFGHSFLSCLSWKIHKECGIRPGCWKPGSFPAFFHGNSGNFQGCVLVFPVWEFRAFPAAPGCRELPFCRFGWESICRIWEVRNKIWEEMLEVPQPLKQRQNSGIIGIFHRIRVGREPQGSLKTPN